uniref:peptidoglycan D,D-transpeptidase FtsI family protein n=1 Tax=Vaginimicrobium propionicum TaxID=1871034 RepID=UPI000970553B|nr:penicillin-binding protein 2 [Vaginimicrobium propionicum]
MNKPLRYLSLVLGLMFFALLANVTASYVVRTDSLIQDPKNTRVRDAQFGAHRGDILAGNTPIAGNEYLGVRPFLNQRTYANGPLYAPITGFYSYNYGYSGLEMTYNDVLTGQADSQFIARILDTLSGREPQGGNILTTIDPNAQQVAWDALGGRKGGIFAYDYTTGEVKVWVSSPSYDPGALASTDIDSTVGAWEQLSSDPNNPMADRATREIYPPGSTFKLVVTATALANGYTPDQLIDTPAQLQLPQSNNVLPNSTPCGNSQQTLDRALQLSCNTTFANLGMALGADKIRSQAEKFGFGERLGIDIGDVASKYPDEMSQAELAMASIGQFNVSASVMQMAVVAGSIANDGVVMRPHIVSEIRDSNQRVIRRVEPEKFGDAMSLENAATLQTMMQHVVSEGTATPVQIAGEEIGGKTGTAENATDQSFSWFTGYMKSSHIAIAVFLAEPGNDWATPLARPVLEALR